MKTSLVKVTTEDKLILPGLLYEPDEKTDKVVVHIHGMTGNFTEPYIDTLVKVLTKGGWAFTAFNNRGHDQIANAFFKDRSEEESKTIGDCFEVFEECLLDIEPWIDYVEAQGYKEVVLSGHSLGCSKATYYLAQTQDLRVGKLILASPADMVGLTAKWEPNQRVREMAQKLVEDGKGDQILPEKLDGWAYQSAKTYLDLSLPGNPVDVFNTYEPKASSPSLEKITFPTLAFFSESEDTHITKTPQEALEIIKVKAKNCSKFDAKTTKGNSHTYFRNEQAMAELVLNWLKDNE